MARIIIALFITGFLVSCKSDAQSWSGIKGEGEVVKEDISLESLKGINLGFDGDVVLTPGSTQKITIEGQKNIIDNIKRDVKNGSWNIVFDKNVREAKGVTVYITLTNLEEVNLSGSGSIRSTGKFTGLKDLDIHVSGSGAITLDYDATSTDLSLSGSGEIDLNGTSKSLEVSISGSGDVNAKGLVTDDCSIHISGSGDASVQANKNLETHISGSGDVAYSGTASVTTRISGSGEVTRIK
ncbi:MAG TPA: head GIN domain-containing protein [Saprospiraceae bacterium]|nr:head GIN domain-containing protein [Saprospiraceae bacterium]